MDARGVPVRTILTAIAAVAIGLALWEAANVFFVFFAGLLFAVLLSTAAAPLSTKTRLSWRASIAVVVGILLLAVAGLVWFALPGVIEQTTKLADTLPAAAESAMDQLKSKPMGRPIANRISEWQAWLTKQHQFLYQAAGLAQTVAGAVGAVLVTFVVGLYLALDPKKYRSGFVRLFPRQRRERIGAVLGEIGYRLKWWLLGRMLMMSFVAAATWIGLTALGVPLAFPLAIIAGLLDFIQNIGPFLAAVPALLLAVAQSPEQALWVAVLYTGVQLVENYGLGPVVQDRTADIPPAVLIIGQIAFGVLFGAPGLILAAPVIAAGIVAVQRLYVHDLLESPDG